jgi:hypothetical protein
MEESPEAVTAEAVAVLRQAGARFAYLHGSRASGQSRDQVARVRWEAMTRKIYFDELPRIARSHREFAAAVAARARNAISGRSGTRT